MAFSMKIENGFKNTENYRCNQVGDSSWMGEDKNCQTSGWDIQLLAPHYSERGGLFKRRFAVKGGPQVKQRGRGQNSSYQATKKTPHIIYHTGRGQPPSSMTVLSCMPRRLDQLKKVLSLTLLLLSEKKNHKVSIMKLLNQRRGGGQILHTQQNNLFHLNCIKYSVWSN